MVAYVKQTVGLGTVPNDDTGDDLRAGADKLNDNHDEIFGATTYDAGGAKVWINEASGIAQSQQGIKLGGIVAANLLDDFEKKTTWSIELSDASIGGNLATIGGTKSGTVTKIGDVVIVRGTLVNISTAGMTAGNGLFIQGLPFVAENLANAAWSNVITTSTATIVNGSAVGFLFANDTHVSLFDGGDLANALLVSSLTSGTADINFEMIYHTT